MDRLEKYVSIVPSKQQYDLQKMGAYAFIHFGMNTFTGKEWGDGQTPPSEFAPTSLSTDQWCEAILSAGLKGVILTAKHHDGFCLWRSDVTEYSVKNSPYQGDVVEELSKSCKKYGLKMGLYLSPWDRNSEYYGTDKYNDFYIAQLTELLTRYGEVFEVWLDGACGSWMDGKPKQVYDFERIYDTVRKLQPNAIISNCGPDVRWIGNEGGLTRDSEWNVVPKFNADVQKIMASSQQGDDQDMVDLDCVADDLGSRKILDKFDEFMWYPAEVDVSIRPGWFYHSSQDNMVRSIDNLLNIYYNSVGGNAMLLLNIPPDKRGLIHENDVTRLKELGERIESGLKERARVKNISASREKKDYPVSNLLKKGVYSPERSDKYVIDVNFKEISKIDKVMICEDVTHSQRIESFEVFVKYRGRSKRVYKGTTVGMKKIALFKKWVYADGMILVITSSRNEPYIEEFCAYISDGMLPKRPKFIKLKKFAHKMGYLAYVKREEKKKRKLNKTNNNC